LQVRPVPKITTKSIGSSTILEKIGVMKRRYVLSTHLEWMFRSGKTQLIDARVHQANAYSLHLLLQVKATKLYRAVGRLMLGDRKCEFAICHFRKHATYTVAGICGHLASTTCITIAASTSLCIVARKITHTR